MSQTLADSIYKTLHEALQQRIPQQRLITDETRRLAYGTDASFYRLIPKIVAQADDLEDVLFIIQTCGELNVPFTFRAAGTSLSGQAVSDSVLITLTDNWRNHTILEGGKKIRLQPGVIGADANRYLAPFDRKIGPDPASINSCKIGGIAANNASGMCCGTAQNTYKTVESMKIVFHDGTLLDTADSRSVAQFKQSHQHLIKGIQSLCDDVNANGELKSRIAHKYRLKNTTGYALNALIDFTDTIDVLTHLMVGSEGTLGFIAEITYHTVIEHPNKASTLLVFNDIETASNAVTALSKTPVSSVEMMDGRALRSVADKPGMPDFLPSLTLEHCALLVECRAADQETLDQQCATILSSIAQYNVPHQVAFTSDAHTVATLWGIRKGMFPAVGAVREAGTTVIIEDVAFPIERLASGVRELQALFTQYDYHEAIIFGHALEGNLHFVFTQGFDSTEEVQRYGQFMDDVAQLVAVKYGGSLKAEHGTGRNMAPYVELEWGTDAYSLMQRIKTLFDPKGLLNPGVIINDDPHSHLKHLKPMPKADDLVDRCIECGFCEAVCPSRTLSLSPRQRIVIYRELSRLEREGNTDRHKELQKAFDYLGVDTCAATGLCADRCPVAINTGDLIKKVRTEKYKRFTPIATWTADHFSAVTAMTRFSLSTNKIMQKTLGEKALGSAINGLRKLTKGKTPIWHESFPVANSAQVAPSAVAKEKKVVYFPSCSSRNMSNEVTSDDKRSLTEVTLSLLERAGYQVITPNALKSLCCGMPYDSKGMNSIAKNKSEELQAALWHVSQHGKVPVLMDTSPCTKLSKETFSQTMNIMEPAGFIMEHLIDELDIKPLDETVMLHITCSSKRMGLAETLLKATKACAKEVIVPEHIECCGFAGDKGFFTPELNESALSPLKAQIPDGCTRGFSNSRTCEIGLTHHSGIPYRNILYLLDEASTPTN
ncbi:FAD-binding and (Fe-S)-binding domain-containing protein [Grimontia sp. NTOU-MAR1]|uniref:FAD-binding and (Fe-S)-binding domain-containing protein n=1 Tax=Grimontia sp. NTOU-MAR1 TaxID=3111011 RepID=UPI002DB87725|nr:FAD-binding and (Fe-S)-binding domain-containing protein [Grimontia sp. NTOU-MAR1]WRV98201.1 FAD-binding and (Fe-S)-binding domain-containing protein [Grimontia sp. NTOU-MAR1]